MPDDVLPVTPAAACDQEMTPTKKKAVQGYLNTLGPKLREQHGVQPAYSPQQVRDTTASSGLDLDFICYAYLLYCTPSDFAAIHEAAGEACDAAVMRAGVAAEFFGGNVGFDAIGLADGLWGGVVSVVETGTDVTVTVIRTGAEVAVQLATVGADVVTTVVSTGVGVAGQAASVIVDGAAVVVDGAGAVFGWLGDVDWGSLFNIDLG